MTDTITITLPLPSPVLSPNARVHWATKGKAVKQARRDGFFGAKLYHVSQTNQWAAATVTPTFHFKLKRKRDLDNLGASLKAYYDGVIQAGLLENDCYLTPLPAIVVVDKSKMECVELRFERTDRTE